MASNGQEFQSGAPSVDVYEIPGEAAIVIDGVPNVDQSDHFHNHIVTEVKSERDTGFGEWMEGRPVQKLFGKHLYSGKVTTFDRETGWYRVVYADGDFEDLEWPELEDILVPLDITVPLKTLALKRLKKNEMHAHKTTGNQLPSRRQQTPIDVKHGKTDQ